VIIYCSNTTALHREHIRLHEAAHIIREYSGSAASGAGDRAIQPDAVLGMFGA
jgi:hypothetical protein